MATHADRPVGSGIVFHDESGTSQLATLIAKQSIPSGMRPDITVGLLDVDIPVKYYKVLLPYKGWESCLEGALAVSTHHTRVASIREIGHTEDPYIYFREPSMIPLSYYVQVVQGTSGNPTFLLVDGEQVLLSTFTYDNIGPFFSEPNNYKAINDAMKLLGGGYQLDPVVNCSCLSHLPALLVSFELEGNEESIELSWNTACETTIDRFEVEKSADGYAYDKIGDLEVVQRPLEIKDYQFIDDSPYAGKNYYRLKQIDVDGDFEYSSVRLFEFGSENLTPFLTYPNPANSEVVLEGVNGKIESVSIYSIDGSFISNLEVVNNSTIDVSSLMAGMYLLKIEVLDRNPLWSKVVKE